ncbi:hypothetical protein ACTXT7_008558 [Hymenolepis weldensis]
MDYIKEAISKSRELIDCDFQRIRRVCDPDVVPCCYGDGCCEKRNNKNIEELWREVQYKISEVSCMMDRIDRLRSNEGECMRQHPTVRKSAPENHVTDSVS